MADDVVRLDSAGTDGGEHGQRGRHEGRLLDVGRDEILERGLEAELNEIETGRLASATQHVHCLRDRLGDLAAHACLQRSLSGEAESDLAHAAISSVHSIKLEPQVRPAPMPVISTSLPGASRPSR